MNYKWRTGRYCVFKNFVHLVFVPKYRKNVFSDQMLDELNKSIAVSCTKMGGELLEFGGENDHIHMMVSVPPTMALCHFVGRLKGYSSFSLRKKFRNVIREKLWGSHLWSPSYCAVSCGGATLEVVKAYIENQRKPSSAKQVRQSLQEKGRIGERSRVKNRKNRRS